MVFLVIIGLIAIGSYMEYQKSTYPAFLDSSYLSYTPILLIVFGIIMLVGAFFGCMENKYMMITKLLNEILKGNFLMKWTLANDGIQLFQAMCLWNVAK